MWTFGTEYEILAISNILLINFHLGYFQWRSECYKFENLAKSDIRQYLKRIGVIKKLDEDMTIVNEKNLIANRLIGKNILVDKTMSICAKHRSSFGID